LPAPAGRSLSRKKTRLSTFAAQKDGRMMVAENGFAQTKRKA
jgi:hypothetical protein